MRFGKQIRMLLATMFFIVLYSNPTSASELTDHTEQTEPYVTVTDGWISRKKVKARRARKNRKARRRMPRRIRLPRRNRLVHRILKNRKNLLADA